MKLHAAVLFVGIAALFWPHAGAQNAPRSAVCTVENSEATSIAAVASNSAAWMGKCVVVEGLYTGERVYADIDAIYGVNDNAIGGFVDGLGAAPGAMRGTFVGRVSDCATAEETLLTAQLRSPGISLHERVLGCTRDTGPFLMFMSTGELKPAGIKRRLPGERGGNLQRADADWEHYITVVYAGQTFELGIQSYDASYLTTVIGNGYAAERLHAGDGSALAALRTLWRAQFEVFRDTSVSAPGRFAGEACWCLKADCTKLWPIHSRDADNQPTRPYACLRVEGREGSDGFMRFRVDASHDPYGLDEL